MSVIISVNLHIRRSKTSWPDTQFFRSLSLTPHHTLYSVLWSFMNEFGRKTTLKLKKKLSYNYRRLDLDIFLSPFTCVFIWSSRKKRITKNCCVFFCFPIQHTHFIQHSTFVRSIPKSFVWRFFFLRDLVKIFFSFSTKFEHFSQVWKKLRKGFFFVVNKSE